MRLLIVSQYFWPENFRINDLSAELVNRGHEVTVLTGKPNYPSGRVFDAYLNQPENYGSYKGVRIFRAPMLARGKGVTRLFLNYLSFVIGAGIGGPWILRDQPFDAIFVFEPSPVTVGLPAIVLGRIKQAPIIFWALDLWPDTLEAIGVVKSQHILWWVGRLVHFIYNNCTLVLGQSRGFLKNIALYCDNPNKIRYFPSWAEDVFCSFQTTKAPEISERQGIFNVLFAGNIGEAQDLPAILDAVEILKDNPAIRWLIVGDGRQSEWLNAEVARRRLQENILILGRFPVERMPSFYAHADALLVSLKKDPVFSKTIPGKVQSYLMSAIPLIGMLDGEGAEIIKQANAGLTCSAGDANGLATAVLTMAKMPAEQRSLLGLNGRKYAEIEFGRENLMNQLEALFREAVNMYKHQQVTQ